MDGDLTNSNSSHISWCGCSRCWCVYCISFELNELEWTLRSFCTRRHSNRLYGSRDWIFIFRIGALNLMSLCWFCVWFVFGARFYWFFVVVSVAFRFTYSHHRLHFFCIFTSNLYPLRFLGAPHSPFFHPSVHPPVRPTCSIFVFWYAVFVQFSSNMSRTINFSLNPFLHARHKQGTAWLATALTGIDDAVQIKHAQLHIAQYPTAE